MQFYLAVLDDTVRMEGENPSIGILICKSKNKTIVEYALKESSKPIGVATYRMVTSVPVRPSGRVSIVMTARYPAGFRRCCGPVLLPGIPVRHPGRSRTLPA